MMKTKILVQLVSVWLVAGFAVAATSSSTKGPLEIWFDKPAQFTALRNETGGTYKSLLPEGTLIGNGRMGAIIKGEPSRELLRLSESTLWTGVWYSRGHYTLLGTFQTFGDLSIDLENQQGYTNYERRLDIGNSLSCLTYQANGVTYCREAFASYPDKVIVVRLTADKPGAYTGSLHYRDSHDGVSKVVGNRITNASTLGDHGEVSSYETQIVLVNEGGTQSPRDDEYADRIDFKGCDSLTVFIVMGTDYVMDFNKKNSPGGRYHGDHPHERLTTDVNKAVGTPFGTLKARHMTDYHRLFNRCTLDLGPSNEQQRAMPSNERRLTASNTFDPEMDVLLFQFGRYLLISASRPGGIQPNSQGVWQDCNWGMWGARYTPDLTSQLPLWPVETTNLAECHRPAFDMIEALIPVWKMQMVDEPQLKTADGKTPRGWVMRGGYNIIGGTAFWWDKVGSAWYCRHYWDHYAFSLDKEFLKNRAYPLMKEVVEFHEDMLKTLPDGKLVVPYCFSPEHGPWEDGVSYCQELVWDLFNNFVKASDILGADKVYRDKIEAMRDKLARPGIGSFGQVMEWLTDKKGTNPDGNDNPEGVNFKGIDTPDDKHRHLSHLWFVYPGDQVSPRHTPEWAEATKVTLFHRDTGKATCAWSPAWRSCLYARLHDGPSAYDEVKRMYTVLNHNLLSGLFTYDEQFTGKYFQFDANPGIAAGIAEMLMQSHGEEIEALPALPQEWVNGSIKGLRARGGFEVDIRWKDGKLTSMTLHSTGGTNAKLRYGDKTAEVTLQSGGFITIDGDLKGI